MGTEVYANGMNIACKAAAGKTIAAMPDVCLSPPTPPAGPVPIPYPNTAMASDTTNGSKTVQINSEEVMLKDQSTFKQSNGDEAATKSLGMGVVTACIQGEVAFVAWSMDVKFEGANVPRHLDLTLHNEQSVPANTPTWPYVDTMAMGADHPCSKDHAKEREACGPLEKRDPDKVKANKKTGLIERTPGELRVGATHEAQCADTPEAKACQKARKCMLTPYKPNRCCSGQTGHHLIEVHSFSMPGGRKSGSMMPQFSEAGGQKSYEENDAPVVCAKCPGGSRFHEEHGDLHAVQGVFELAAMAKAPANMKNMAWNYGQARSAGVAAHQATFPDSGCNPDCIKNQLDSYHKDELNVTESTPLRTEPGDLGVTGGSQWQRGLDLIGQLARRTGSAAGF